MGRNDAPISFAELIEAAQKAPEPIAGGLPNIVSPFERPLPKDHRLVTDTAHSSKIPGMTEYDYQNHVEYFSIPKDSKEYESILDKIAQGEAFLRYEDKTFTKEGDYIVVICYLTRKVNAKAAARKRSENEEEEREEAGEE